MTVFSAKTKEICCCFVVRLLHKISAFLFAIVEIDFVCFEDLGLVLDCQEVVGMKSIW